MDISPTEMEKFAPYVAQIGRRRSITKKQQLFLKAMETKANNIAAACRAIGIGRSTYTNWLKKSEYFKERIDELLEADIDFAETMLKTRIKDGDTVAIMFFLKTKGKGRGYVERQENANINLNADIGGLKDYSDDELTQLEERLRARARNREE